MNLKTFFEVSTALGVYKTGETVKELATRVGIQESEVLKLNANENLFLPLDFMQDVLGDVVKDVDPRLYPSEDRNRLQKALGGYLGVSPEQIVLGAGGDQLIELVLHAFLRAGDRMLIVTPTFSMYERTARNMGADCMTVDIEEVIDSSNGCLHFQHLFEYFPTLALQFGHFLTITTPSS